MIQLDYCNQQTQKHGEYFDVFFTDFGVPFIFIILNRKILYDLPTLSIRKKTLELVKLGNLQKLKGII